MVVKYWFCNSGLPHLPSLPPFSPQLFYFYIFIFLVNWWILLCSVVYNSLLSFGFFVSSQIVPDVTSGSPFKFVSDILTFFFFFFNTSVICDKDVPDSSCAHLTPALESLFLRTLVPGANCALRRCWGWLCFSFSWELSYYLLKLVSNFLNNSNSALKM